MSQQTTANIYNISIHAPPRGATEKLTAGAVAKTISIHAPPRGATYPSLRAQHRPA